jgi:hypothetical protein
MASKQSSRAGVRHLLCACAGDTWPSPPAPPKSVVHHSVRRERIGENCAPTKDSSNALDFFRFFARRPELVTPAIRVFVSGTPP